MAHLLNHKGRGSLSTFLAKEGLADSLSAEHWHFRGFTIFAIRMDLTEEGMTERYTVVKHVLEYLEMLRKVRPQEWVWNEIKDTGLLDFNYGDPLTPADLVTTLAQRMFVSLS